MTKKLYVDANTCIWCWACVAIWDEYGIYDFNQDNKAYVKKQPETEQERELAEDWRSSCPVEAISLEEN